MNGKHTPAIQRDKLIQKGKRQWIRTEHSYLVCKHVGGCRKMLDGGGNCVWWGIFRTQSITEMERTAPIPKQQLG